MKRLMLMFAAAFAVAFGSQAALAQHNQAQTAQSSKRIVAATQSDAPQTARGYPTGPGQNPKEYPASLIAYLQPFMPKDTKVGVGWMIGRKCDQNGNFVESGSSTCQIYISHSAGKTYISRRSEQEGDRVFVRNGNKAELYVHFNGGRYANTIAYQSPTAQQFASASGSQTVPVVASSGEAPAERRNVNCKDSNIAIGDRIACASGKVSGGSVVAAAPAVAAPTTDCSQGTFVQKFGPATSIGAAACEFKNGDDPEFKLRMVDR